MPAAIVENGNGDNLQKVVTGNVRTAGYSGGSKMASPALIIIVVGRAVGSATSWNWFSNHYLPGPLLLPLLLGHISST